MLKLRGFYKEIMKDTKGGSMLETAGYIVLICGILLVAIPQVRDAVLGKISEAVAAITSAF